MFMMSGARDAAPLMRCIVMLHFSRAFAFAPRVHKSPLSSSVMGALPCIGLLKAVVWKWFGCL